MNMFQNRDRFLGCLNNSVTEDSLLAIFRLAKRIRLRLDKQGYLLDCYLTLFLEGAASGLACDIADDGFMAGGAPQSILFHVLDGTEPTKPDSLYKQAQEYYEQHRDNFHFQERYTNMCLFTFPLADKFTMQITDNFLKK